MKKQHGFTLIELVVVIVILGILAITAAPKFLSLQENARKAQLDGMKGTIASALDMGYGTMAIAGLEQLPYVSNTTDYPDKDGNLIVPKQDLPFSGCKKNGTISCTFLAGYPDADAHSLALLIEGLNTSASDWDVLRHDFNSGMPREAFFAPKGHTDKTQCVIRYAPPSHVGNQYELEVLPCK